MRVVGGLVQEQVLHDDAFHRRETGRDVLRVGVGLQDVLALDVEALNVPSTAASSMLGMRRPGSGSSGTPQSASNMRAGRVVGDVAIARQLVRERAHVAGALHVVLAAQRVHADAGRPMLPVAIARLAIAMTVVEPWLCSVTPRP